jgi:hypothetical protein
VAFAKLIEQLMSKRPEARPSRAADVQRWLAPWSGDEPALPMDVAVDNSSPREVFDLETDQTVEGSFWESVPVAVYVNPSAPGPQPVPAGKRASNANLRVALGLAAVAALFLWVAATVILAFIAW